MVALCLSVIDFIYLFMKFKETLAPEKRLKSLQAALNQAITYVNPISLFNFQSLDNLKEEELASIKTIGKNMSFRNIKVGFLSPHEISPPFLSHARKKSVY